MFTGIVENMGVVASLTEEEEAWRLVLQLPFVDGGGLKPGDSLGVDGCCLTVTELSGQNAFFDLLEETLLRTTFGSLAAGDKVNLERSLAADGRLGGHFVTGHVDATGEVIVPLDADLQNPPSEIPKLLAKLDEGFDVVSGWRKDRQDKMLTRKIPSQIANWLVGKIGGVPLHDYGCSLKAYRREVIEEVRLYGEMHRFIPIYAKWQGAKVTEIPVLHRAREFGETKYGLNRTFKVILDLFIVKFLKPPCIYSYWG
jgi:hypothetical protein